MQRALFDAVPTPTTVPPAGLADPPPQLADPLGRVRYVSCSLSSPPAPMATYALHGLLAQRPSNPVLPLHCMHDAAHYHQALLYRSNLGHELAVPWVTLHYSTPANLGPQCNVSVADFSRTSCAGQEARPCVGDQ